MQYEAGRQAPKAATAAPAKAPVQAGLTALSIALALTLGGCSSIEPGPQAGTAACSALLKRLPERVLNRSRTDLDVAGAAAWGDPAIVLRCGVPPTGPTDDPCLEVEGLDWTFTETEDDFRFITYGRNPAVDVQLPTSMDRTAASAALVDLAPAVAPLPVTSRCL